MGAIPLVAFPTVHPTRRHRLQASQLPAWLAPALAPYWESVKWREVEFFAGPWDVM